MLARIALAAELVRRAGAAEHDRFLLGLVVRLQAEARAGRGAEAAVGAGASQRAEMRAGRGHAFADFVVHAGVRVWAAVGFAFRGVAGVAVGGEGAVWEEAVEACTVAERKDGGEEGGGEAEGG